MHSDDDHHFGQEHTRGVSIRYRPPVHCRNAGPRSGPVMVSLFGHHQSAQHGHRLEGRTLDWKHALYRRSSQSQIGAQLLGRSFSYIRGTSDERAENLSLTLRPHTQRDITRSATASPFHGLSTPATRFDKGHQVGPIVIPPHRGPRINAALLLVSSTAGIKGSRFPTGLAVNGLNIPISGS